MTTLGGGRDFLSLLAAPERSPEIPESHDIYGWLVGSWELRVCHYKGVNVSSLVLKGEAHFAWVLEGRAIQDVWIMPSPPERSAGSDRVNNMYGTTLRMWDPALQAWRIRWINPVSGYEERQTGRKIGADIVQLGTRVDGTATRWKFTEIGPDSFHWTGEALQADGETWLLEGEFRARRI